MQLSDLKPGDVVIADEGFTCLPTGPHKVHSNLAGQLFINCKYGQHFLNGQVGDDGHLVGISEPSHA